MQTPEDQPLFKRMGKVYKLLVNEKTRRAKEEPYLLETAEIARLVLKEYKDAKILPPLSAVHILDLACGTGFHSRLFAKAGYRVTALDYSPTMLAAAKKRRTKTPVTFLEANLLEPLPITEPAALTLLLGNTLCTFPKPGDLRRVFRNAADASIPGGLLLCQVINHRRLEQTGGSTVTRCGIIEGRETVLTKALTPVADGTILITMTASQKTKDGDWETASHSSTLSPLLPRQIQAQAKHSGWEKVETWGSLDKSKFDPEKSSDCVLLFRKNSSYIDRAMMTA